MDKRGWLSWVALTKNPLAAAILMPVAYDFLSGRVVAYYEISPVKRHSRTSQFRSHFGFRWSPLKNLDKPGAGSVVNCWPSSEAVFVHRVAQHVAQNLVSWTCTEMVEDLSVETFHDEDLIPKDGTSGSTKVAPKKPTHNWFSATTLSSLGGGFQFQPTNEGQIKPKVTNQVWTAPICLWFASFPPLEDFDSNTSFEKILKAQKPQEDHRPIEHKWWSMQEYATIIVQNVSSCKLQLTYTRSHKTPA